MKGGNAQAKRREQRLTRLHNLVLQANRLLERYVRLTWRAACWLCRRLRLPGLAILHVATVVGLVYLVWDSLFQTTLALNVVYSDAATGLENPITLQNKSNLFSVRNIKWECRIKDATFDNRTRLAEISAGFPQTISVIPPGQAMNVACQKKANRQLIQFQNMKLASAHIIMDVSYDADFFGLWQYPRTVHVPFTWVGTIANPQWVQWDFVE